ncbi:BREX-1 system adenine-specific DNA-methyltransferase PglX [Alkalihalobacterium alkalinitrilicum]|uniref:BREX-1 system adenine-specific DNA-methyltransferase PglX n=1 Tax=Alkalihalobacterium alkalinitrilicum TaxID=427920 RepID=UPI00099519F2|nr:BREX-1 system adenine-specific DNA-methyltransferase PglX [Alkalihalobacterium alkalinitrilicum]
MNKSAIRQFAVKARLQLISDIEQKAYELGITNREIKDPEVFEGGFRINQRIFQPTELKQRQELVGKIAEKGFEQVLEEVAFTWFNRLIALRFMEVNDYLPTGVRVLSSEHEGQAEPDILSAALDLDLGLDRETIYSFQDSNDTEGLFKYLLIKQCNALHTILPIMFEEINDYTEILLPMNLLQENSVIHLLITSIPEGDWKEQVEIIGWLYQFYISEKKDDVFARLKKNEKVTKENIPAATQLFTPKWIVQYMVENSLGRLWLESHPNEELKRNWTYYLDGVKQDDDIQQQINSITKEPLNPEEITVIDPCMGSGHILVYAFDVLYDIYTKAGYSPREIPKLILEKNLYGIDIDDRAAQLAYFAIMMKARSYHRRLFQGHINVNLCAIQESNGIPQEAIDYFIDTNDPQLAKRLQREDVEYFIKTFEDAEEFGSILEIEELDFSAFEQRVNEIRNENSSDLFTANHRELIMQLFPTFIHQAKLLSRTFSVVVTNPPYMGIRNMNTKMAKTLEKLYPNAKYDLFSIFIARGMKFLNENGYNAMVTMQSWMFLSSFEQFRNDLQRESHIVTLNHLENMVMGIAFGTAATVWRKKKLRNYKGVFCKVSLSDLDANGAPSIYPNVEKKFVASMDTFHSLPSQPITYWIDNKIRTIFTEGKSLGEIASPRQGMATSDNDKYLRYWFEVRKGKIGFNLKSNDEATLSQKKWFPYNKGGKYRKWFGNAEYVVNWEDNGSEIKEYAASLYKSYSRTVKNIDFFFKESITWSKVTSGKFSVRYIRNGFIFDVAGCSIFDLDPYQFYILSLLNSKVNEVLLSAISTTINFEVGTIKSLPILLPSKEEHLIINELTSKCIEISKQDWDLHETSWDFSLHPFLYDKCKASTLQETFDRWKSLTNDQFSRLKMYEEQLNEIFIQIYGLEKHVTPEIQDKDIVLTMANVEKDVRSFISYAVGCMFGRYSLDEKGLVFAGDAFESHRYQTYATDAENVIPITDEEYFDDDIVTRFVEFVKVVYGRDKLEENLQFIAEAVNKKSTESSRQAIRRYFIKDFFKDHVQVYKKRPIYWLFDSGKQNGFKALVYLHRYDEGLVARVRTEYLHLIQRKYETELERLDTIIESDVSTREYTEAKKRKETIQKQIIECQQYDQAIAHVANKRIQLNLDHGIKSNYAKFQGIDVIHGEGQLTKKMNILANIKL